MGFGRIPGVYGRGGVIYGCVFNSGPLGVYDEGGLGVLAHFTPGPLGTGNDLAVRVALPPQPSADEAELELLVKTFGTLLNKQGTRSYSYREKKATKYRVDEYVADRVAFFGAGAAYADYLAECRNELDTEEAKLRKFIEPPVEVRRTIADWKKAQDVFYVWVRKAYENKLGADVDVPKLIKAQMSEKLKKALEQVQHDYGKGFQYGGFNPRPMKKHGYRLGTISEHALGTAIDIDATRNPHLLASQWKALLGFTGKTADHSAATWKTAPKTVYDNIKAVNDAWVTQLAEALKSAGEAIKEASKAPPATGAKLAPAATALQHAIASNSDLKTLGSAFVQKWTAGFFALPWELVKELHEEGFLWGATFNDLDLHHFEL